MYQVHFIKENRKVQMTAMQVLQEFPTVNEELLEHPMCQKLYVLNRTGKVLVRRIEDETDT